jgi:hypothetical protein
LLTISCFPRQFGKLCMGQALGQKTSFSFFFFFNPSPSKKIETNNLNRFGTLGSIFLCNSALNLNYFMYVLTVIAVLIGVSQASPKHLYKAGLSPVLYPGHSAHLNGVYIRDLQKLITVTTTLILRYHSPCFSLGSLYELV